MKQVCKFWKAKCIVIIRAKCSPDKKKNFEDRAELRRAARMYAGYRFIMPPGRTRWYPHGVDDNVNRHDECNGAEEGGGEVNDQANNENDVVYRYGSDVEGFRHGDEHYWHYDLGSDSRYEVVGAVRYDNRYDYDRVVSTYGMIEDWDVSLVDDFSYIFYGLADFNENIGGWDTSRVQRMDGTFWGANQFNRQLFWDSSHCTSMKYLFCHAHNYNQQVVDLDTHLVVSMECMFGQAHALKQAVDFDTNHVQSMDRMFWGATSFNHPVPFSTLRVTDM